jgi:hypothetical protein
VQESGRPSSASSLVPGPRPEGPGTLFDRFFGPRSPGDEDRVLPGRQTAPELGKVWVRRRGANLFVRFTILQEPQGAAAEGWRTGVALDASASMKGAFGRELLGELPSALLDRYRRRGLVTVGDEDGRCVRVFRQQAFDDALQQGHLKPSDNVVEPLARALAAYLADCLDAQGRTTVVYHACGVEGRGVEVVGDFTEAECQSLDLNGPPFAGFGGGTRLTPALRHFAERFADAARGLYVFLTDGRLDDLEEVQEHSRRLAADIAAGHRPPLKCVLIGVGEDIDEGPLRILDHLDTGTDIDLWDCKIAKEMRALVEVFAELASADQLVAPAGAVHDAAGNRVWKATDGLPALVSFVLPASSPWFELEVAGRRVRQEVS